MDSDASSSTSYAAIAKRPGKKIRKTDKGLEEKLEVSNKTK